MRTATSTELEMRAADALRALLGRISGARLRELTWVPRRRSHTVKFVAQVEVFGHAYTLACGVHASEDASNCTPLCATSNRPPRISPRMPLRF